MKKIIAKSYARLIVAGRKTMDEVPEDMKSYVEEALEEMGYLKSKPSTDKKEEETPGTNTSETEYKDSSSTNSDNKEQTSDSSTTAEQEN